ncbi:DivIVA domain-containing protein [Actinoplanes sp. NEAU-A12]|uniref:Cell wall synthesis protein Wag31 n=2 Tax=Actinoplanes sandaracinus TaxID=3045177 RepID=A0ABT6WYQ4_9ACTN|nr:DivIVA domain-containing protein [Actinoplanes sandaracinus]
MAITPADIHNMDFRKPPIGKRGYDEEEVDALLDEAAQELIRLIEENGALNERLRRTGGGGEPPTTVLDGEAAELAIRLGQMREGLARAEHEARRMQEQLERARHEARTAGAAAASRQDGPAGAGGDERDVRVLMMAQRTADEHVRDAQQESDRLLADAQARADQVTGDARHTAVTIEADAQRHHTEAMDGLARDRAQVLEEIDRLGQLAVGYRSALGEHVNQQLHDLDGTQGLPAALPSGTDRA